MLVDTPGGSCSGKETRRKKERKREEGMKEGREGGREEEITSGLQNTLSRK